MCVCGKKECLNIYMSNWIIIIEIVGLYETPVCQSGFSCTGRTFVFGGPGI